MSPETHDDTGSLELPATELTNDLKHIAKTSHESRPNKDEAVEGAYAEKPFLDALHETQRDLSPEQQEAIEWLSSEAAERAMAKYRESKKELTDTEQAIVDVAMSFAQLTLGSKESTAEHNMYGTNRETTMSKLSRLEMSETILDFLAKLKVQEILSSEYSSDRKKLEAIKGISSIQGVARGRMGIGDGNSGSYFLQEPSALIIGRPESDEASMWGVVVADLPGEVPSKCIFALDEIAKIRHTDFATEFEKIRPMVELSNPRAHDTWGGFDTLMEQRGYIWSTAKNTYLRLAQEVA